MSEIVVGSHLDLNNNEIRNAGDVSLGTLTEGEWQAGVIAGAYGGTGVANSGKTITLGGDLTTSGAFGTTLTVTGTTSVTLPTSGTLMALDTTATQTGTKTFSGSLVIDSTTDASSTTTGSIQTDGGVGIAKALRVGTDIYAGSSAIVGNVMGDSVAVLTTGIDIVSITPTVKILQLGLTNITASHASLTLTAGSLTVGSTTDSSSSTTGSLKTAGGAGIAKALYVGTTLNVSGASAFSGALSITDATDSSSTSTGALKVSGGLGVAKKAYIGTDLDVGGNLNGRDPDTLAAGPASATDNALVRFDGTGGDTVQNSGITVDDSGNVTSNLTVSKASAALRVAASSGDSSVYIDRAAGSEAGFYLRSGTSPRWGVVTTNTAEAGSDAGSNFLLGRFSDAGSYLGAPLTIVRSTGKTTLGSVGATAGLELGSGGPSVMSGTGSPEGVVTAPVGSQWTDTAATTGAIRWIKAGTGNTGWVVSEGDTGSRDISSVLTADADRTLASTILLRRTGNRVVLSGVWRETTTSPNNRAFYSLPVGFRPAHTLYQYVPYDAASTTGYRNIRVPASGNITYGGPTSGSNYEYHVQWTTPDAWPSSLPGSAA